MTEQMKEFTVHGRFLVSYSKGANGAKLITKDQATLWEEAGDVKDMCGVYVFCIGNIPYYVGKTTRTFEAEAFQPHKLSEHYNPALHEYHKGRPYMYFVAHPNSRGQINASIVAEIEKHLIFVASVRNPYLTNKHHKPKHKWRIKGVIRASQGEGRADAATSLRACLGLK